jgi:hypothetical protein
MEVIMRTCSFLFTIFFLFLTVHPARGSDLVVEKPVSVMDEIPNVFSSQDVLKSMNQRLQSPGTVLDSTYYDYQANGGLDDHLIMYDDGGTVKIHGTMMIAYLQDFSDRSMNYYHWDGTQWDNPPGAMNVFPTRNGFGSLSQLSDGSVVVCTHTDLDGYGNRCFAAVDASCGSRSFSYYGTEPDLFSGASFYGAGQVTRSVVVGDFNEDGHQDLAVSNKESADVAIYLGTGTGTFSDATFYGAGDGAKYIAVGDFDEDGHQDLAVANADSDDIAILLGTGMGNFLSAAFYRAGDEPWSVAVGDFNEDGHQDLAVTNENSGDVTILLGMGTGAFHGVGLYEVGIGPRSVAVGDFNEDSHQDLAVGNWSSDDVTILLGTGTGAFHSGFFYSAGNGPEEVTVGDFNEDGHQDLAVANEWSDDVAVLLGTGSGIFSYTSFYGAGDGPQSVTVGDFNEDGHQDLAVAIKVTGEVAILLGMGTGTFLDATFYGAGEEPESVTIGDFNEDGHQDLAVANGWSNDVAILLGTSHTDILIWPRITVASDGSMVILGKDYDNWDISWAKATVDTSDFGEWTNFRTLSPNWINDDMDHATIESSDDGLVGVVITDIGGAIRYYHSSDNGDTFTEYIIAPADTAGLPAGPDSTASRLGAINSDIIYVKNKPHVVWSAGQGVNSGGGTYDVIDYKATIFHWSPSTGIDTVVVASTQSEDATRADYVPRPWNSGIHLSVDWPSIGLATDGETLVLAFKALDPDDIDSTSYDHLGNLGVGYIDIWVTASTDDGNTWSDPVNLTNPNGQVLGWDDRYPSIAKINVDNAADPGKDVYMIYQSDDLGGTSVTEEGTGEGKMNIDYIKFVGFYLDVLSSSLDFTGPIPGIAGMDNTFGVSGATPGEYVHFFYGLSPGSTGSFDCLGVTVDIDDPIRIGYAVADNNGVATITAFVPERASGRTILFQATEISNCEVSNLVEYSFP